MTLRLFANNENWLCVYTSLGLSRWCIVKESAYQCRRHTRWRIDPWVRVIPWSRKSQPTPGFLPGIFLDKRAWQVATVQGLTKCQTWLGNWLYTHTQTHIFSTYTLQWEKEKQVLISRALTLGTGIFLLSINHFTEQSQETGLLWEHDGSHLSQLIWMTAASFPVCLLSSAQSSPTLCNPMNRSTPGLPVHHKLPEFTQTHAHQVGDAIQPSHPLLSPPPPALNSSQHQGLFQWVNSSHEVAKVLDFQLQHQSFQWTPRTDLLQDGLVGSPCSPRDSQESSTPQLKSINFSALSFFQSPTLTSILDHWKNHSLDQTDLCWQSNVSAL